VIHSDDWAVILRWPRLTTVLEVLVLAAVVAGVMFLFAAGLSFFSRKKLNRGHLILITLSTAVLVGSAAGYLGFRNRSWQAACWRLGPEGVPVSDREGCKRMPAQGNEGHYRNTMFWPS